MGTSPWRPDTLRSNEPRLWIVSISSTAFQGCLHGPGGACGTWALFPTLYTLSSGKETGTCVGGEETVHGMDQDLHVGGGHVVRIRLELWLDADDERWTDCREQTGLNTSGFGVQYEGRK